MQPQYDVYNIISIIITFIFITKHKLYINIYYIYIVLILQYDTVFLKSQQTKLWKKIVSNNVFKLCSQTYSYQDIMLEKTKLCNSYLWQAHFQQSTPQHLLYFCFQRELWTWGRCVRGPGWNRNWRESKFPSLPRAPQAGMSLGCRWLLSWRCHSWNPLLNCSMQITWLFHLKHCAGFISYHSWDF